jgi:hypothetical protein
MEQKPRTPEKQVYGLEKAQNLVASYKKSGLSQTAFCRLHEIKYSTFKNWLYLSQKAPLPCPEPALFTSLKISDPQPEKPSIPPLSSDLQVRQGEWTIIVPVGFDGATLSRLLRIMRG